MRTKRLPLIVGIGFTALIAGCYVYFLVGDFSGAALHQDIFKYIIVILTPLMVLSQGAIRWVGQKRRALLYEDIALLVALVLTAIADYFLLFREDLIAVGVGVFVVAQIAHMVRTLLLTGRNLLYLTFAVLMRVAIASITFAVASNYSGINFLTGAASLYGVCLCFNFIESTVLAFVSEHNRRQFLLLSIGFALFIACDVFVGLRYLGRNELWVWMWFFYAPSQALIAWSTWGNDEPKE